MQFNKKAEDYEHENIIFHKDIFKASHDDIIAESPQVAGRCLFEAQSQSSDRSTT